MTSEWSIAKCRGCGADIIWTISPTGARLPLSVKVATYSIQGQLSGPPKAERANAYISHFVDCPKRDDFTRAKTREGGAK